MGRKIASEMDLRLFHNSAVESFVAQIISGLAANQEWGVHLTLGQGVTFENHTNTLSDVSTDVQNQLQSISTSNPSRAPPPTHADQICVYKKEGGQTELLFIIEYKAPHKLTKELLRVGLRTMDLPTEVINRPTIPTDPLEKFNYNADKLVAAAATQTYSYMLESGVEYSCIITGEAIVFLWIKKDDSNTLYYHLAEPNEEVYVRDRLGFQHPLTAVGQLLSFCLMAFRSQRRNQQWRDTSTQSAQRWTEDWEKILRDIPREERKIDPPVSAYKVRRYHIDKKSSPYYLRQRPSTSYPSSCSPDLEPFRDDHEDSADSFDDGPETISTPSKSSPAGQRGNQRQGTQNSSSAGIQHRQYCTQRCLLGLAQGSTLDEDCPNVELHRHGKDRRTHLLNKQEFCILVQQQLAKDLDHNCKELKKQGLRGSLFQITLISHGYTFVGKATRDVYVSKLQHEGRIYDRLKSVQGMMIPVYLGNIDLERPWRDLHVQLIHMLLMSWGGEKAERTRNVNMEIKRFENKIERLGVRHNDIHSDNMLWNDEVKRIMFIDFEAATETRTTVLQELSGNRKRKANTKTHESGLEDLSGDWRLEDVPAFGGGHWVAPRSGQKSISFACLSSTH